MRVTLSRPVVKRCPHRNETDAGTLVIDMPGPAPELHKLASQVDDLTAQPISHEDFTAALHDLIPDADITTTWTTGPWAVEVRIGEVTPE